MEKFETICIQKKRKVLRGDFVQALPRRVVGTMKGVVPIDSLGLREAVCGLAFFLVDVSVRS